MIVNTYACYVTMCATHSLTLAALVTAPEPAEIQKRQEQRGKVEVTK